MSDGAVYQNQIDGLTFNAIPIGGKASGTSISVAWTRPNTTMDVGVDGVGYWVDNDDRSATITVVLQPNADENAVFQAADNLQRQVPATRFAVTLKRGATVLTGFVRISGRPPVDWSDTTMPTTWTMTSTRLVGDVLGAPGAQVP